MKRGAHVFSGNQESNPGPASAGQRVDAVRKVIDINSTTFYPDECQGMA